MFLLHSCCRHTCFFACSAGAVITTSQPVKLRYKRSPDQAAAAAAAADQAASREASANASPDGASGYGHSNTEDVEQAEHVIANVTVAASAQVAKVSKICPHFSAAAEHCLECNVHCGVQFAVCNMPLSKITEIYSEG